MGLNRTKTMRLNRIVMDVDGKFVRISTKMDKVYLVSDLNNASLFVNRRAAKSWVSTIKRKNKKIKDIVFREIVLKPTLK